MRYAGPRVNLSRAWSLASLIVVASWHPAPATAQTQSAAISKERVTFKSGGLTLVGFLFKPDGAGPFPALVWNHGSERNPGTMRQFVAVAAIFVPAGYVVFAPMRRGHGIELPHRARTPLAAVVPDERRERAGAVGLEQKPDQREATALEGDALFRDGGGLRLGRRRSRMPRRDGDQRGQHPRTVELHGALSLAHSRPAP